MKSLRIAITPRELEQCLVNTNASASDSFDYNISHILIGVPPNATQQDIDAAVLNTLENTPLPSLESKAYAAILPSVVRVVGIGPEEDDDEKAPEKGAGKAPGSGKGKFVVPGQPPEKSATGRSRSAVAKPRPASRAAARARAL